MGQRSGGLGWVCNHAVRCACGQMAWVADKEERWAFRPTMPELGGNLDANPCGLATGECNWGWALAHFSMMRASARSSAR